MTDLPVGEYVCPICQKPRLLIGYAIDESRNCRSCASKIGRALALSRDPTAPATRRAARFAARIDASRRGPDECWIWPGPINETSGYGTAGMGSSGCGYAHRRSYEMFVGPIPAGLLIRHNCDVPSCVNPAHLQLGTYQDNTNDMLARERESRGEACVNARLTAETVREIRRRAASGASSWVLAREPWVNGADRRTIDKAIKRETWAWLDRDEAV